MDANRRFLVGKGGYVDDLAFPNTACAAFLRSPYSHALIKRINVEKASRFAGILLALDASALASRIRPMPVPVHPPKAQSFRARKLGYTYLARDRVRYVGEPIAAVVGEDEQTVEDALDLIDVDYETLAPVMDAKKAVEKGSPLLYDDWGDNIYFTAHFSFGDYNKASNDADVLLNDRIRIHRQAACPMEPRGCVADYDRVNRKITFYSSSQNVYEIRLLLAYSFNLHPSSVRVVAPDVGGGFGLKSHLFNEDVVVVFCSMLLNRPVKWIESRRENLLSCHAREQTHQVQIAARRDGEIIGFKDRVTADLGAYALHPHGGLASALVTVYSMPGPYRFRNLDAELIAAVTNKAPFGAYRGFGVPEATFALERMIDKLAGELKMDATDVRMKNFVREEEFPYVSATGAVYDAGKFRDSLGEALRLANYASFRRLQDAARKEGRHIGIGVACYVRASATPTKTLFPMDDPLVNASGVFAPIQDAARVRIDGEGVVTVFIAGSRIGSGADASYVAVAAKELGVSSDRVEVVMGDTDKCPEYGGVFASRSTTLGGLAVVEACRKLREELVSMAGEMLGVSAGSVEIIGGKLVCKSLGKEIALKEVMAAHGGEPVEATARYQRPTVKLRDGRTVETSGVYCNGADVAVVEVDPETLEVKVLKYALVHDAGPLLNKQLVEGQIIGGLVQGLGGCLLEEMIYDSQGQLLTSTLMDYMIPSAVSVPNIEVSHLSTPSTVSLYGSRSVGESGPGAVAAAIAGAIEDALAPLKIRITETTLKPDYLFKLAKARKTP